MDVDHRAVGLFEASSHPCKAEEKTLQFFGIRAVRIAYRKPTDKTVSLPMASKAKTLPQPEAPKTRTRSARTTAKAPVSKGSAAPSMRDEVSAYRKDLIVRAASEAFFEHGYNDCTVDMIAEKLSGTKAIVYYYFADKRSILEEIFRRALNEAQELIRQAIDEGSDPRAKLAAFARLYGGWVIDNQRVVGVIWREERSLSLEARDSVALGRKAMDDLVALIIREGVSKGQFDVDDVRTTARAISGMISYTYSWWRSGHRLSREDIIEYYAGVALRIVGAAPPRS